MKPYYETELGRLYCGDALEVLGALARQGIRAQTCVTSPPYWGLRDYGVQGQLGLEKTPWEYIEKMSEVFDLVKDALADDGTLWLNLGDTYAHPNKQSPADEGRFKKGTGRALYSRQPNRGDFDGFKTKDLMGLPWRVAFALQSAGWYLRQDIIWHKPNPMPESATDRCTKAHEYIFLLSKKSRYFYDYEAIRVPGKTHLYDARCRGEGRDYKKEAQPWTQNNGQPPHKGFKNINTKNGVNRRSVWTVQLSPYTEAHFATYPPQLIVPCILAGSRQGDTVLDPFFGAGTTGVVAEKLGRRWIGIELSEEYCSIAARRLERETAQQRLCL